MTLIEFLLARIAEDETEAAEIHRRWYDCDPDSFCSCGVPGRIKAESAAKREIVERCCMVLDSWAHVHDGVPELAPFPDVNRRERSQANSTLSALARVYVDHPDYRDEWR